jgi:trans-aconitate methyltransferase
LRRPIAAAIDRDGDLLDVGCANGHLLECLVDWTGDDGHRIVPYGLDVSAALVARARERLTRWSNHLFVGDVRTWSPPRRFDFVRSVLVYVSEAEQPALVARLLTEHALLGRWGHSVVGAVVGRDPYGLVLTNVAWVDAAR